MATESEIPYHIISSTPDLYTALVWNIARACHAEGLSISLARNHGCDVRSGFHLDCAIFGAVQEPAHPIEFIAFTCVQPEPSCKRQQGSQLCRGIPLNQSPIHSIGVVRELQSFDSHANLSGSQVDLVKAAAAGTAISTLLAAGNAQAAQEIANLAARDNRAGTLALLLAPALGWVAFNILGPALNQFKGMQVTKRSAAVGLGLSAAALLATQSADAAEEIAQVFQEALILQLFTMIASTLLIDSLGCVMLQLSEAAGRDNRVLIIATLFLPVVGWVGFNILGPALNQLKGMQVSSGAGAKNPLKGKKSRR